MTLVNEAYAVLSNPDKKKRFDEKYDSYLESLGVEDELKYEYSSDEGEEEKKKRREKEMDKVKGEQQVKEGLMEKIKGMFKKK